MLKTILAIAALMLLMLLGLYYAPPHLPTSHHQPLHPQAQAQLYPLDNPASLQWLPEQQRWVVGSLSPQTVLKNGSASLTYFDPQFNYLHSDALPTSGDLADFSLVNEHLVAINENGKLLFFTPEDQHWLFAHKRRWLKGGVRHKTAALAWDPVHQQLLSCEREGLKRCYLGSHEASIEREFDLSTGQTELDKQLLQLEISSMSFHQQRLYALSRQQKQLLQIDPQQGVITQQWSLTLDAEPIAIASNGDSLWLMSVIREQPKQASLSIVF